MCSWKTSGSQSQAFASQRVLLGPLRHHSHPHVINIQALDLDFGSDGELRGKYWPLLLFLSLGLDKEYPGSLAV